MSDLFHEDIPEEYIVQICKVMAAAGLPTPRFQMIKSKEDLEAALKQVGFPAVLKPVFGAAAMFVVGVASEPC